MAKALRRWHVLITSRLYGRWDYIFSFIKTFRNHAAFVMPDRGEVTMTVHFLRSYSLLVIKTCHRRKAFAMGGMAAQIPNRLGPAGSKRLC